MNLLGATLVKYVKTAHYVIFITTINKQQTMNQVTMYTSYPTITAIHIHHYYNWYIFRICMSPSCVLLNTERDTVLELESQQQKQQQEEQQ